MEEKIERVHDVLVREEARLQQWIDLGVTGIKSKQWNQYSIGIAAGIMTLAVVFKRQIYDTIGREAAELTETAISDPKLVDRVKQLIIAIGKSPETVHALTELLQQVFKDLGVLDSLVDLTTQLLAKDATRQSLQTLLIERVFGEVAVQRAAGKFITKALQEEETKAALQELIKDQVHQLLRDEMTHYEAAAASKSTLGRTFWLNRKPEIADSERGVAEMEHSGRAAANLRAASTEAD